jgi:archaellum component FlaC
MLEERDLQLIKQVVHEVIEEQVVPHFVDVGNQFLAIDQRFDSVHKQFESIAQRFEGIDRRFDKMDQRFENIEGQLNTVETTMVTKDYLEDRLSDFKETLKQSGARALYQIKKMATELHRSGNLTTDQLIHITTT